MRMIPKILLRINYFKTSIKLILLKKYLLWKINIILAYIYYLMFLNETLKNIIHKLSSTILA